ncbi:hypothetical protein MMARJ_09250 [Mycobacterium marseillense]|uniref:Uncharacterized protein n=1 Tax=Mycobacterium marseillense TaxID=701042 RepID=A0ABN5ZQZ6_9MYCO|nr:hypothetical protein MMARJ_09250 [Mycobacterium marseillense]
MTIANVPAAPHGEANGAAGTWGTEISDRQVVGAFQAGARYRRQIYLLKTGKPGNKTWCGSRPGGPDRQRHSGQ